MASTASRSVAKRRRRTVTLVVLLVAIVVIVVWPKRSIHNGTVIFYEVASIRWVAPHEATNVQSSATPASWIGGCSEIPGSRSGWTTDTASLTFTDTRSRGVVTEELSHRLRSLGWRRHDQSPNPGQGKIAHWTLYVGTSHRAQAWAFPVGPGTAHWAVSSSWIPPGPRGEGCP